MFRFAPWDKFRAVVNHYLKLNRLVTSTGFDLFMLAIIIINMALIFTTQLGNFSDSTVSILDTIDMVFVYVFLTEFIIKVIGLGVGNYFKDNWNKFDFMLV